MMSKFTELSRQTNFDIKLQIIFFNSQKVNA